MEAASLPTVSRSSARAEALRMLRAQHSVREVALMAGLSKSAVGRLRRHAGVPRRARRGSRTHHHEAQLTLPWAVQPIEGDVVPAVATEHRARLHLEVDLEEARRDAQRLRDDLVDADAMVSRLRLELDEARHAAERSRLDAERSRKLARRNRGEDAHHVRTLCALLAYISTNEAEATALTLGRSVEFENGVMRLSETHQRLFGALRAELESKIDEHYLRRWKRDGLTAVTRQSLIEAGVTDRDQLDELIEEARQAWIDEQRALNPYPYRTSDHGDG